MLERVIIAGFGGQGIISLGKLYASLAAERFEHVTFFPSYGAEVRGGTANCSVILSDEEIASPLVEDADTLIIMNQMSADRFGPRLLAGGLVVLNSSLVSANDFAAPVEVPATEVADQLGDVRAANIVMFGAYLKRRPLLEFANVAAAVKEAFGKRKPALGKLNAEALKRGYEL